MASTNPARGTRDFLPTDVRKREYVIGIIKKVYESYGFEPLETPAFENIETLMGKYGDEGNQLIFRILKRGEKLAEIIGPSDGKEVDDVAPPRSIDPSKLSDLALRYDLTVPLARVVANNRNELPKFFKRYQIQPVWRADRPARGRFREFFQCDVDAIGSRSIVVEAEIIGAVANILKRLGFEDFVIRVNDRRLLNDLLTSANVPIHQQSDALVAIDKLDKIGLEGVLKEFRDRGIVEEARSFVELFDKIGPVAGAENKNEAIIKSLVNSVQETTLHDISRLLDFTAAFPVRLDPSLARGLSYYTGTIMEINVPDLAGSLGGGGRYDGLIGMFGKEQIPACGFSLGLERILVVMDERGMFPPEIAESASADVLVAIWNEETAAESLKLAAELRSNGLRVTVYPEPDKLGKQLKYADSINVPFACIIGENEIAEGKVTLKDLSSGEQQTVTRSEISAAIMLRRRSVDSTK